MALGMKRGASGRLNPGDLQVKQVTADGAELTSPDTWKKLGYVTSAKISDVTDQEIIKDEAGNAINALNTSRTVKLTGNLAQMDKDLQDFLTETCRGNLYQVYKDEGVVDGKNKELFLGICAFKPQYESEGLKANVPFEIISLSNLAALTLASGSLPSGAHATAPVTIPAGKHYVTVETTIQ